MQADLWTAQQPGTAVSEDMAGYQVEGNDGAIGKVERVSYGGNCLFVSTSRFFGKTYVIPAGAVERIETDETTIFVNVSKEEVEESPEYDSRLGFDEDCENRTGTYYTELAARRASAP